MRNHAHSLICSFDIGLLATIETSLQSKSASASFEGVLRFVGATQIIQIRGFVVVKTGVVQIKCRMDHTVAL